MERLLLSFREYGNTGKTRETAENSHQKGDAPITDGLRDRLGARQMTFLFRTFFTLTAVFLAPRSSSGPIRWPHA